MEKYGRSKSVRKVQPMGSTARLIRLEATRCSFFFRGEDASFPFDGGRHLPLKIFVNKFRREKGEGRSEQNIQEVKLPYFEVVGPELHQLI